MLEFPGEWVNLRKSAVFCESLRFGLSAFKMQTQLNRKRSRFLIRIVLVPLRPP